MLTAAGAIEVLPDILELNLSVVFCGSAASSRSASSRAYYAGPGNRFWMILHKVGLIAECLAPADYAKVLHYSIGLTDLAKHKSGADSVLQKRDYDRQSLAEKIARYGPSWLAFNGKRSASLFLERSVAYGVQSETCAGAGIFVLPSTSGAAQGFWCEEPWWQLAELVRMPRTGQSS